MPELPEVQTVVNTLLPRAREARIERVELNRPDIVSPAGTDLPPLLTGRRIADIARRAKRIVFTLDTGERFYIHLGMTGRLTVEAPGAPLRPHTHLLLHLNGGTVIHFTDPRRFGGVFWLGVAPDEAGAIGPEPLTLRTAELARRLGRTRRPIKSALLDQRLVAGLGNIYVDESLFDAAIHPLTPANALTVAQVSQLNRSIKKILNRALRARGSTQRDYRDASGRPGEAQRLHRVYDKAAEPCPTCRTPIARIVISARSTHFCPSCQDRG